MNALSDSLLELIRRTSTEIPDDVHAAILDSLEQEKKGTIAESAMKIIDQNIALAKNKSQPICQDTGSIIFYVDCPANFDQMAFTEAARACGEARDAKGLPAAEFRGLDHRARTTARMSVPAHPPFIFISMNRQKFKCA